MDWQAIETAPRDGTDVLVFHKVHGAMTARFCAGEWSEHHEYGRQYDGPVWCFGDDAFQEEVEEGPDGFHDGPVTHWQPPVNPPRLEAGATTMTERLLKAADAVKDDVCSLICPSTWKTGERPPHHPKCVELRAALSEAIDEASYADLRASGGIANAP